MNILFNLTNAPITNYTKGVLPGPLDLWVMYTKTMMVSINYDDAGLSPGAFRVDGVCTPCKLTCLWRYNLI